MALSDLEVKYFDIGCGAPPVYRSDTALQVLIDGAAAFRAMQDAIEAASGPGDAVYLTAWQLSASWCLGSGARLPPSHPASLAQLLLRKAESGVDVRVIVSTPRFVTRHSLSPFCDNLLTAELLQTLSARDDLRIAPLAGSVLCDWSGAPYSGSHHQKSAVVKAGRDLVAIVGGIDCRPEYWDFAPHATSRRAPIPELRWPDGSPWGWHDVALRLQGRAAGAVWDNFRQRWNEALTLPLRAWPLPRRVLRPRGILTMDTPSSSLRPLPIPAPQQSVQLLRSRYTYKVPNRLLPGGRAWDGPEPSGLYEVWAVLRKAIFAAETYIYLEDQFLRNTPHLERIPGPGYCLFTEIGKALVAKPGLRAVLVGSGKSDPRDIVPTRRQNRTLTSTVRKRIIDPLGAEAAQRVAVWRVEDVTVHSKLLLVDDEFAAIGSANVHRRSMYGIDSELHVAVVAEDNFVQRIRCELWAEHWQLTPFESPEVHDALTDVKTALGLWQPAWSGDPMLWRMSNRPRGYEFPRGRTGCGAVVPVAP